MRKITDLDERVLSKIVQARYSLYLYYWNIGDDEIKRHNSIPDTIQWPTVSEAFEYYMKAWVKAYNKLSA